ncbi:MAG: KH domain-containing protein [Deltaproteobacteria bacterium]|nr:KH domain-containing protein [Deltaproteobacteria bacterium]
MNAQIESTADLARRVTSEILERMGIPSVLSAKEGEDAVRITIHAHDSGLLIGKQGATLNAIQLLVGLIVNREQAGRAKVVLDAEGYRSRRQASLEATAHRVAEKAISTGKTMEIHTMSSYERRIIHMTLAPVAGVSTRSEGEGPARRLLVIPDSPRSVAGGPGREEGRRKRRQRTRRSPAEASLREERAPRTPGIANLDDCTEPGGLELDAELEES